MNLGDQIQVIKLGIKYLNPLKDFIRPERKWLSLFKNVYVIIVVENIDSTVVNIYGTP